MYAESDTPPAYPTHTDVPPSSEATTAPAYTPRYTSTDEAEGQPASSPAYPMQTDIPSSREAAAALAYTPRYTPTEQTEAQTPPAQASRNLPPSRPLQRPDRLNLTNQLLTSNTGRTSERDEESGNTTTNSSKPSKSSGCGDCVAFIFCIYLIGLFGTMCATAIYLTSTAIALKDNTWWLKRMYEGKPTVTWTVTQTVTKLDPGLASTVTVTADGFRTLGIEAQESVVTVTETVWNMLPTGIRTVDLPTGP